MYRGSRIGNLAGAYLFADFCVGQITALAQSGGRVVDQRQLGLQVSDLSSFGQDQTGELYALAGKDRLAFWAEGTSVDLPNSKIAIDISTGYHDWAKGCRELRCYWPNYFYDVGVGTLDPDIAVGWRFSDYRNAVDTVLERALD